jgi:Fic family protein
VLELINGLKIIPTSYFASYEKYIDVDLQDVFSTIEAIEIKADTFNFYTSVSVIASSKIEGEAMEMDSYLKHKLQKVNYLKDLVQKPNDLYEAYIFAQENCLSKKNFFEAHKLLSKHLLPAKSRGKVRQMEMVIMQHETNRIQYEAAPQAMVKQEFEKLFADIDFLIQQELSINEVFYYASFIHLVFVNIHPFEDGNGRAARLLEKWFLAEKLGKMAWCVASEHYYYKNVNDYYKNLAVLGFFYESLEYSKALGFLKMLPDSLKINKN